MKCKSLRKYIPILFISIFVLIGCSTDLSVLEETSPVERVHDELSTGDLEYGEYYETLDEVVGYLNEYGELPANYITKAEAEAMEWTVEDEPFIVGGDPFGNREGLLPEEPGRQYYEADIQAGYTSHRGPKRLVFSNDGLIFYTDDHYDSFERLY